MCHRNNKYWLCNITQGRIETATGEGKNAKHYVALLFWASCFDTKSQGGANLQILLHSWRSRTTSLVLQIIFSLIYCIRVALLWVEQHLASTSLLQGCHCLQLRHFGLWRLLHVAGSSSAAANHGGRSGGAEWCKLLGPWAMKELCTPDNWMYSVRFHDGMWNPRDECSNVTESRANTHFLPRVPQEKCDEARVMWPKAHVRECR